MSEWEIKAIKIDPDGIDEYYDMDEVEARLNGYAALKRENEAKMKLSEQGPIYQTRDDKLSAQAGPYHVNVTNEVAQLEAGIALKADYIKRLEAENEELEAQLSLSISMYEGDRSPMHNLQVEIATLQNQLGVAMSENARLTKIVEDYEEENKKIASAAESGIAKAWKRVEILEAKLAAIECAGCGKKMLECECDE